MKISILPQIRIDEHRWLTSLLGSILLHAVVFTLITIQIPGIYLSFRPDFFFLGAILSERDFTFPHASSQKTFDFIVQDVPEDVVDANAEHYDQGIKIQKFDAQSFSGARKQYKSSFQEFAGFPEDEPQELKDLGLPLDKLDHQPLKLYD